MIESDRLGEIGAFGSVAAAMTDVVIAGWCALVFGAIALIASESDDVTAEAMSCAFEGSGSSAEMLMITVLIGVSAVIFPANELYVPS